MNVLTHTLPVTLQQARKARRLSQLELSMRVGVSQRHVSFVESGRSKPSRDLLMAWLRELEAPLAIRNAAMLQAGYAPAYSAAALEDLSLAHANAALLHLLQTHDPMPAMVIGAQWDLLHMNRGAQWLASTLMPWTVELIATRRPNMLDMLIHPDGFTKMLVNLDEVGPIFLSELRDDVSAHPQLAPKVEAFALLLKDRLDARGLTDDQRYATTPMLTLRFATAYGDLSFFRMFSTFGPPQDITLSFLKVEHMFAADEATKLVLYEHVGKAD
ncbi:MAG: helix-turn-helix transcriptional regulator [Rhodocyclaceae bacterium]|nr:helix-turn-helix transcriptional regulator [Rhodocyclaceae bacterium]